MDSKRGLRQDASTRWNSTNFMLESAFFYSCAFFHLELRDSIYKNRPFNFEWEKIEKIKILFKVLYDATYIFFRIAYHFTNMYFPSIFACYETLKENVESEDLYLKLSLVLTILVVIDPRYMLG